MKVGAALGAVLGAAEGVWRAAIAERFFFI